MSADGHLIYLVGILVMVGLVVPLHEWLRLRRQLQQAETRAEVAERQLQQLLEALDEQQRAALQGYLDHAQPMPAPPAGLAPTLRAVQERHPDDGYAVPLGWVVVNGVPDLATVSLHGDSPYKAGHILLTGETDWGKDAWAVLLALTVCHRTTPTQFRLFWIDGKGADAALWDGRAHNWRPPITRAQDIRGAVKAVETEREQRAHLLQQHRVTKWEELPAETRPPLLWVYVSELKLLRKTLGKDLEHWLEAELASARACGIRYCIATQTATNMKTEWRSQVGLFVAGGQASRDGDKPNIGLGTDEIRQRGGLPPSVLDTPGTFTIRNRRRVITVRTAYLTLAERKAALAALPAAPGVATAPPAPPTGAPDLSLEQYQQVCALLGAGRSDGQIVAEVFGVTGGRRYQPLRAQVAAVRADYQEPSSSLREAQT